MRKLERKHISLIHVAKSRLALSEEAYRDILLYVGGVKSSRDLDWPGFTAVMDYFAMLGFKSNFRAANFGDRPGMATARQVAYIRHLWRQFTDGEGTDLSLGKWLASKFKVGALRFVDAEAAPRIIAALLSMNTRKATTDRNAG